MLLRLLLFAMLLAARDSTALTCEASHGAVAADTHESSLPAEAFFVGKPKSWGYRVSPDGKQLLWLAVHNGKSALHYRSLASTGVRVIHSKHPVRWAYWSINSRHIALWSDERGDENYQLFVADTHHPRRRAVNRTDYPDVRVYFHQEVSSSAPTYLLRHNFRDAGVTDLVKLNLTSGDTQLVARNPGNVDSWITDTNGDIIARFLRGADYGWILQRLLGKEWQAVVAGGADERLVPQAHALPGSSFVWALSNRGRDRMALVKLDLRSGQESVFHESSKVDVEGVWIDTKSGLPRSAWSWPNRQHQVWFDPMLEADQQLFAHWQPYSIHYDSESEDKRFATVTIETDRRGKSYHLIDRALKQQTQLSVGKIVRRGDLLVPMESFQTKARDGLELNGYVTLPADARSRPLPTVLIVHGGPFSRDRWGYKALDQFLANRGYAVARVNFRGSTGYGRSFVEAARGEFAGKMQTDLIDAVNWLVARGISDPDAVGIYGASYGGYAALVGLTRTPAFFRAAVDIAGPANLQNLLDAGPAYWRLHKANWYRFIGNPDNAVDREVMQRHSPSNYVGRIQRPVLVIQGDRDVRVLKSETDKLVTLMRKAHVEVDYLVIDDEGHVFRKLNTHVLVARAIERFFHHHLGGRFCQ